ncbi:SDR family oxidoreductase [Sphingomonas sp. 28-62-11]|uniref:SDR family NAD(P)-dependent oxidoreductase n=1 Tax=Sphingomonas sp. 28-62-11 TaxID=1970432 RepID=UPI000BDBE8FE|nr:MAG: acetoin dehydrogenase [Sphingomonas sp. 28-62-11]
MKLGLNDAVVVLTGAASGIGAAMADQLAAKGARLALIDKNGDALAVTVDRARAAGVEVTGHVIDVTDRAAVAALPEQVLAAHGRTTVLVNGAGVTLFGNFDQLTLDEFDWIMDVNFNSMVRMTHAFMPVLKQQPQAYICNISSVFGLFAPPSQAGYAASKFAVRGFSEALRHELEGSSIGLTIVHPGGVNTAIARDARVSAAVTPQDAVAQKARAAKLLKTSAQTAARQIIVAIESRQPRLLIGGDARMGDLIQRLFPATYWSKMNGFIDEI